MRFEIEAVGGSQNQGCLQDLECQGQADEHDCADQGDKVPIKGG